MTHHDKDFWMHAVAYVCLGTSLFLIVTQIVEWSILGGKFELHGAASGLMIGTFVLARLSRKRKNPLDP